MTGGFPSHVFEHRDRNLFPKVDSRLCTLTLQVWTACDTGGIRALSSLPSLWRVTGIADDLLRSGLVFGVSFRFSSLSLLSIFFLGLDGIGLNPGQL